MKSGIKLVHGVGLNDSKSPVTKSAVILGVRVNTWRCPFYAKWCDMLMRCYSESYLKKNPAYIGCAVCEDWLTFSNFKDWMEKQDWEGKEMDKDLLGSGKFYCPDFCCFISRKVNGFLVSQSSANNLPIGVSFHKDAGKYVANCKNPHTGKAENLGLFKCKESAHLAWKIRKRIFAIKLSEDIADEKVAKALASKY